MRILVDIKHPAHVHIFKNVIKRLSAMGHRVLVAARKKDMTLDLLDAYGIPYVPISSIGPSKFALVREFLTRLFRTYRIARNFKPDVFLDETGITTAPIARMLGIPSLVLNVTENARITNFVAHTCCTEYITPQSYKRKPRKKNVCFPGYHTLSYLHPKYFTSDPGVLRHVNVEEGDTFTVVRFVSWASHDLNHRGISEALKIRAADEFLRFGKVFITSETPLPRALERFQLILPFEEIHSLLYYASLVFGESATMTSEAAVLGTHAVYVDDQELGFTDDQEKRYGLVHTFSESREDQELAIAKGVEILRDGKIRAVGKKKRERLLEHSIDVTEFFVNEVLKYQGAC